jgi:hypothetical protein
MEFLPPEMWNYIFKFLDFESIKVVGRTCLLFKEIISNDVSLFKTKDNVFFVSKHSLVRWLIKEDYLKLLSIIAPCIWVPPKVIYYIMVTIENKKLEALLWLCSHFKVDKSNIVDYIDLGQLVSKNQLKQLRWINSFYGLNVTRIYPDWFKNFDGKLKLLIWLYNTFKIKNFNKRDFLLRLCRYAAFSGDLAALRWLNNISGIISQISEYKIPLNRTDVFKCAMVNGHLHILKWIVSTINNGVEIKDLYDRETDEDVPGFKIKDNGNRCFRTIGKSPEPVISFPLIEVLKKCHHRSMTEIRGSNFEVATWVYDTFKLSPSYLRKTVCCHFYNWRWNIADERCIKWLNSVFSDTKKSRERPPQINHRTNTSRYRKKPTTPTRKNNFKRLL